MRIKDFALQNNKTFLLSRRKKNRKCKMRNQGFVSVVTNPLNKHAELLSSVPKSQVKILDKENTIFDRIIGYASKCRNNDNSSSKKPRN